MENTEILLKAIADSTRLQIIVFLLRRNICVGALARKLNLSEAAVSQHLKLLREVGLVRGEKHGYFMHYEVNREQLRLLAKKIDELAMIERETCRPEGETCSQAKYARCHQARAEKQTEGKMRFGIFD